MLILQSKLNQISNCETVPIDKTRLETKDTNIGVMDQNGKIIKRSSL